MTQFTFTGCSFTHGVGVDPAYPAIVAEHYRAELKNLAIPGHTNAGIFIDSLNEILYHTPDTLFVQWSGLNRHCLYPGLNVSFHIPGYINQDLEYLDFLFTKSRARQFVDDFQILNHDYHNILLLINYCKILETVSKGKCRLVFINGLVPWTEDMQFLESLNDPYNAFSKYTKDILSFDLLPDDEIEKFFKSIALGLLELNKSWWVNMFSSIESTKIDVIADNQHPGPKTHSYYATQIIKHLESWPKTTI